MSDPTELETAMRAAGMAAGKAFAGRLPGVGEFLAGYDAYRASMREQMIDSFLADLKRKVGDLEDFFSDTWFMTEEGILFVSKVADAAIDLQNQEKIEFLATSLVSGTRSELSVIEKTQFVDMLRRLSRASLLVLVKLYSMMERRAHRPGRRNLTTAPPVVHAETIAHQLSDELEFYSVVAAVRELEGLGLFSNQLGVERDALGGTRMAPSLQGSVAFTDFTARFCEFITTPEMRSRLAPEPDPDRNHPFVI